MKRFILALSLALAGAVHAAPTLTADAYPATGVQPDAASFTINGGAPIACTVSTVSAGVQPACNLASVGTPGAYVLVMTVTKAAGCSGSTCWAAGSASSAPFNYNWLGGSVPTPVVRLVP